MNLFVVRKHLDKIIHPIVSTIGRLPITATQWTAIGAVLGAAGGVALYYGQWWAGCVLLVVRGLVDHVDGYVARNFNQRSTFGAVMDDVVDRWTLGVMYGGACIYLGREYTHALILMGVGITGALTNVIIKLSVYAEAHLDGKREKGKYSHPIDVVGLFGSAEFILYFGVGLLLTAITHDLRFALGGVWAVAILSHVSLLQRVWFARRRYRRIDPAGRELPEPADEADDDDTAPAPAPPRHAH
jgi:archaetidylinositol phosphate synthase